MMAKRTPWVLLVAAVVFLGTLDLHPVGEAHDTLLPAPGNSFSVSARHPGQPAHFESAQEVQRPVCPACLHQLQTSGAHLPPGAIVTPPAPRLAPARDLSSPTTGGSRQPRSARAPPQLS